jgi:hypothetical protein
MAFPFRGSSDVTSLRPLLATSTLLAVFACAGGAAGEPPPIATDTAVRVVVGKALLDEGKKLFEDGRLKEAQEKIEASLHHDPTAEAMLVLGACQEKRGATATAWGTYHRAEERARTLGDKARTEEAAKRAGALEPRLSRVKVVVTSAGTPPQITLDDRELSKEAWGVLLPLDPGTHRLFAWQPEKQSFSTTFDLATEGEVRELSIPELLPEPKEARPPVVGYPPGWRSPEPALANVQPGPVTSDHRRWRAVEKAGIAMVSIGTTAGVTAIILFAVADSASDPMANRLAYAAGGTFGAGFLVGLTGFFLLRDAEEHMKVSRPVPGVNVRPLVARTSGGLSFHGVF